jgi:LTXXQ motif family protein
MSALRASVWAPPIGIAAIILLAVAMLDIGASARGMGGGARGGGGRGVSFGRGGPGFSHGIGRSAAVHSFSAPHVGRASIGSRSFSGNRTTVGSRSFGGNRFAGRTTATGSFSHAANVTRAHQVFGNRVITNAAFRSAHVPFRFQGRFFGSPWPWWWGGIVIGWVGPVFWPYAYYDFFDYVFWPYAYDDFWPYAYDDIYYGIYGPYAYSGPLAPVASVDPSVASSPRQLAQAKEGTARQRAQRRGSATRAAEVCSNKASELTQWPIERISQVVQPTEAQRAALDELKAESDKAIDLLKGACPNDLPSIPTGRLAAMQTRLETMLAAVKTVHPALDHFYQSLSDEQKARFNAIAPGHDSASAKDQRNLVAFCTRTPGVTDLPMDRIAEAVQPSESQRAALDELREASTHAAASLKADCPTYQVLTPVGRTEAMEQRLAGTLSAVKTVEPALTKFYDLLSDEQKARFNALRTVDGSQG